MKCDRDRYGKMQLITAFRVMENIYPQYSMFSYITPHPRLISRNKALCLCLPQRNPQKNAGIEDSVLQFPIELRLARSLSKFLALGLFYTFYYCAIVFNVFVVTSPTKAAFSNVSIKEQFLDEISVKEETLHRHALRAEPRRTYLAS